MPCIAASASNCQATSMTYACIGIHTTQEILMQEVHLQGMPTIEMRHTESHHLTEVTRTETVVGTEPGVAARHVADSMIREVAF